MIPERRRGRAADASRDSPRWLSSEGAPVKSPGATPATEKRERDGKSRKEKREKGKDSSAREGAHLRARTLATNTLVILGAFHRLLFVDD